MQKAQQYCVREVWLGVGVHVNVCCRDLHVDFCSILCMCMCVACDAQCVFVLLFSSILAVLSVGTRQRNALRARKGGLSASSQIFLKKSRKKRNNTFSASLRKMGPRLICN